MINDFSTDVPLCCRMSACYSPSNASCAAVIARCPVRFKLFVTGFLCFCLCSFTGLRRACKN